MQPVPILSPAERWVSVDDVAAHLGVRKDSIYRWIEGRSLPARKIGKLWKLKLSEVDRWVRTEGMDAAGEERPAGGLVLVVDDDSLIRETLRDVLSDHGYESVLAGDGLEALAVLRREDEPRPGLILLDLQMPNFDGIEFLQDQRNDPTIASIPVIIISADRGASGLGANVLRKPLDLAAMVDAVRGVVGAK